jgi:hypothetical protein
VFDGVIGLGFVQALSGLGWGALEYASFQLLLTGARDDCRVEFLSLASTMGSSGQLIGAMAGGYMRTSLLVPYKTLFLLSSFGRAAAMAVMLSDLPLRLGRGVPRVFLRVISVRPGLGTVDRPIVSDAPPPPEP